MKLSSFERSSSRWKRPPTRHCRSPHVPSSSNLTQSAVNVDKKDRLVSDGEFLIKDGRQLTQNCGSAGSPVALKLTVLARSLHPLSRLISLQLTSSPPVPPSHALLQDLHLLRSAGGVSGAAGKGAGLGILIVQDLLELKSSSTGGPIAVKARVRKESISAFISSLHVAIQHWPAHVLLVLCLLSQVNKAAAKD